MAHGPMEDKGVQLMDMDNSEIAHKRFIDGSLVHDTNEAREGGDDGDVALKRQKLGLSHDLNSCVLAEVGNDQPRLSL